jgi:uncharacterized protein (TIGR02594 family)
MAAFRSIVGGFYSNDPTDKSVPVSIRMNNPGAINGASWERTFPGYVSEIETTPGNKSTIFETPENGVAAWFELMRRYRVAEVITVGGIIRRYGGGQDYEAYVRFVIKWSGLSESVEIQLDGKNDQTLLKFARAMFRYEAGKESPLSDAQILYGFKLGRGDVAPTTPLNVSGGFWSVLFSFIVSFFDSKKPLAGLPVAPDWYVAGARDIGFHETGVNLGIERFIASAKTGSLGDPWCAIWINAKLEDAGVRGSRSPGARSFERDPNFTSIAQPCLGCIVTMWRGTQTAGTGHVFFYDGENSKGVRGIGANESDGIRRSIHDRARIVGYYWPKGVALPKLGVINAPEGGDVSGSEV